MLKKLFNSLFSQRPANNRPDRSSCINQSFSQSANFGPQYNQQFGGPQEIPDNELFEIEPEQYKLSGPFKSENLTVFLVHGTDKLQGQSIVTLEEAMEKGLVLVEETSNVNLLSIKNLSDKAVFLQSGDIVRGGRQDRTIQYDLIVPKGKEVPLPTFCVEQGRWSQRQAESVRSFSSSSNYVAGKRMKVACKYAGSQSEVWENVAAQQRCLSKKVGFNAADLQSTSSHELTLESSPVKEASKKHIDNLAQIVDGKSDVIGFAFAINGKLNSADVYASSELFKKLWLKLLKSTAVEVVAETQDNKGFDVSSKDVLEFLAQAQAHKAKKKYVTAESVMLEQEGSDSLLYRTQWCNAATRDSFIHCNFLVK